MAHSPTLESFCLIGYTQDCLPQAHKRKRSFRGVISVPEMGSGAGCTSVQGAWMLLDEIWQFHQGWDPDNEDLARTDVPAGRLKVKVLLPAWAPPSPFTVVSGAPQGAADLQAEQKTTALPSRLRYSAVARASPKRITIPLWVTKQAWP